MATDRKTTPWRPQTMRAGGDGSSGKPIPGTLLHKAIARRAYELYEAAGRPEGQALAHWLQAEAELLAR